jgi:hypothetical protein
MNSQMVSLLFNSDDAFSQCDFQEMMFSYLQVVFGSLQADLVNCKKDVCVLIAYLIRMGTKPNAQIAIAKMNSEQLGMLKRAIQNVQVAGWTIRDTQNNDARQTQFFAKTITLPQLARAFPKTLFSAAKHLTRFESKIGDKAVPKEWDFVGFVYYIPQGIVEQREAKIGSIYKQHMGRINNMRTESELNAMWERTKLQLARRKDQPNDVFKSYGPALIEVLK